MAPARYDASKVDASPLAKSLHFPFSGKTASNRFLKAAMTERLSSWSPDDFSARGVPSSQLLNAYRRWGEGSMGLILTGNIMIEPDQLEARGNPIIPRKDSPFSGERFEAFKEMGRLAKAHGSLCVGQVSHPGRQCEKSIQPDPVSASDVQLEGNIMGMQFAKPHPATKTEIMDIIDGFAHAAEYLQKAGYDGIQLHGAHGYLLAQFLSETTNQRTDQYGGSLANRCRIIVEIAQEIRKRVSPDFMVGIKLNSVEFQAKGFSPEDAKELCEILEGEKFDFIELSGGTYEEMAFDHKRESTKKREAFFIEFAQEIVPGLRQTKTYVTGGLRTVPAMVDALRVVDGIGLARPVCQEPALARDILAGEISSCVAQLFDQNNFGLTNVVAGSQIRQIGRDQQPLDGSQQKNVDAFMKDMHDWSEKMASDQKMREYGYVDINSMPPIPYGAAQPA